MKKILIFLLLFISIHVFAQTDSIIYLKIPVGGGGAVNTKFVNTTANILALNTLDSTKQLFVADTAIGGTFNIYTGNDVVDSAIIFQDAVGRKWKRNIVNGAIDIRWFGAQLYFFDSYNAIQKAINYHAAHKGTYVYIPNINGYFYSSQTFVLTGNYIFKGDQSPLFSPTSQLLFPANKTGIRLMNGQITMSDIGVNHSGFSIPDSTAHGVELHGVGVFNNVSLSNASGDNLHIDACASAGTNADQSSFINCGFHGALNNGVFITGCDANIMLLTNCVSSDNNHWGYYDNGFLGNTYVQCQTANDGNAKDVIVNYNGHGYVARNLSGVNNINQKPDAGNSYYWYLSEGYGARNAWDSTKNYYSGGAYTSTNQNAFSQYQNCYSEGYEAPSSYEGRTQVLGGIQAAGVIGGARIFTLFGSTYITGSVDVSGSVVGGQGIISANNSIKAPDFYASSGLWFADGRDLHGTGASGGATGLALYSGGQPRIFIDKDNGFVRFGLVALNGGPDQRLTVDGNISLNGSLKVSGSWGNIGQVLISGGATGLNSYVNLDSTTIPQLTSKINITGGTMTGALMGLSTAITDSTNTFATTKFTKQLLATIPKQDSAFAGYGFKIDSIYTNGKYNIQLRVDSAKISADSKSGLSVTGSTGSYNRTTGVLSLTGMSASSGVFTPTVSNTTNVASATNVSSVYTQVGNIVHVRTTGNQTPSATGVVEVTITLPVTTATTTQVTIGTVSIKENGGTGYVNGEVMVNSATTCKLKYYASNTGSASYTLEFDYQL